MGAFEPIIPVVNTPHYAAFISYAHKDEGQATKLHRLLERYRPPRELKEKRHLLRPIFRDKDELTASHSLTDKIRNAVERSRKLIVLCSPAAKASKWVNAEIHLFREHHGEDAILCALIEGTPETAFPLALTEGGREPLAADLTGKGEAFRHGTLQLAASMMDVGLDDLVRREVKRRRRIGSGVVLGALAFSGMMAASTLSAVKARQLAEDNRAQAEDLVEYMITDLKTKLEPVGRLDILDGVGDKVMEYYSGQDLSSMPDERVARQAKAMHLLGQVALDEGNYDTAKTQIDAAYALTKEVLYRNPDDTDAIFAHAQSAYWVGKVFRDQRSFDQIRPYWQEYSNLSYRLYETDKNNFDWIMEAALGENYMGIVERVEKNSEKAQEHYRSSISLFDAALLMNPDNASALEEKADVIVGAEQLALSEGDYETALKLARENLSILTTLSKNSPNDVKVRADLVVRQSILLAQYGYVMDQEELKSLILDPIRDLGELIKYDEANDIWRNYFIWHHYYAFKFSHSDNLRNQVLDSYAKSFLAADYKNFSAMQKFPLYILAAQQNWTLGYPEKAFDLIEKLKVLQQESPNLGPIFIYFLAETYEDVGLSSQSILFANNYLAHPKTNKNSKRIDSIMQLGKAYALAGDCAAAAKIIKPVRAISPPNSLHIAEIIQCKA